MGSLIKEEFTAFMIFLNGSLRQYIWWQFFIFMRGLTTSSIGRVCTRSAGGRRSAAAVLLGVFGLGVLLVELERPEDGFRDGRRGGQVGALRLEAVLVGDVGDGVGLAVVGREGEGTLGGDALVLASRVPQLTLFLGFDTIAGLVAGKQSEVSQFCSLKLQLTSKKRRKMKGSFKEIACTVACLCLNIVQKLVKANLHWYEPSAFTPSLT